MRRLRILIVTTDFPPSIGGIQQWTTQVASQLSRRHQVTVIAPSQPGFRPYDAAAPFRVVRFPRVGPRPVSLGLLAAATLREMVRLRPDVVFFCHIFAAIAARSLCRRLHVPYVVAAYGMELQARRAQPFLRDAFRHSARCITISQHTARLMHDKGARPGSIASVGVGVPTSLFTTAPLSPDHLPNVPQSTDPVIVTIARLDERYKGHDMMLHALPLILARIPRVTYVIASDGRYRTYYENLAAALGVRDRVIFAGRVSDDVRLALYDRCDLFALISREAVDGGVEGFGIVFLEAAARGKPAVGGRSGGVLDAIVDGVTGLLVEPTDPAAIADACVRLLVDHDLARRLGHAGRERVRNSYTWERVAGQIELALLDAAPPRGAHAPA